MFRHLFAIILLMGTSHSLNAKTSYPKGSKNIKPNSQDITSARLFAQILRKIKNDKYSVDQINRLKKTDKYKTFEIYKHDLDFLISLRKTNSKSESLKNCQQYFSIASADNFERLLRKNISQLCHNKFMGYIEKDNSLLNKEDFKAYLVKNGPYLATSDEKTFVKIMTSLETSNAELHSDISTQLYKAFIHEGFTPNFNIMSVLPIDKKFTQFVQKTKNSFYHKNKIFKQEMNHIYENIKTALDNPAKREKLVKGYVNFFLLNKESIDLSRAVRQVEHLSRYLAVSNNISDAQYVLNSFLKVIPQNSEEEYQVIFKLLWIHLINDDFKTANSEITRLGLTQRYNQLDSKLKFWVPYILRQNNNENEALQLYQTFLNSEKKSYYSVLANKDLSILRKSPAPLKLDYSDKYNKYVFAKQDVKNIRRMLTWLEIDYLKYADLELKQLITTIPLNQKDEFLYKLTSVLNQNDQFLFTFKTLYHALDRNLIDYDKRTVQKLFPLPFYKDIQKLSKQLDPVVVISLVRQESAFNPRAKSSVGARGLMQLMPATARQMKRNLKVKNLKRPEINLELGIRYLNGLVEKYEGNLIYALAAYNAGEGRVKNWRKDIFKSQDPLVNIEGIPFNETQKYVKLIYRNIFFYKHLMNEEYKYNSIKDTFYVSMNAKTKR